MSRLEVVDGENWRDLLAAPAAVLVLGRSDCAACGMWTEELESFLAADENDTGNGDGKWMHVRFGRLLLDQPGLLEFKKAHPWIAEVCELPTNLLFLKGVKKKTWLGGRASRLEERLAFLRRDAD